MPTGRKPGRPPEIGRRIHMAAKDAALEVVNRLISQAKLGDVAAGEAVLKLALAAPASPQEPPK